MTIKDIVGSEQRLQSTIEKILNNEPYKTLKKN